MAGDWIKMRTNLLDDPRVLRMCDLTGCSETQIVGGLYWLWAAADSHTETGLLPGLTPAAIDRKAGVNGFAAALVQIGWIAETPDGIEIVRFDEHNGQSAKKRAVTARRVANHRKQPECNAGSVTENSESPDVVTLPALAREREEKEKRREEEKIELPNGSSCPAVGSTAGQPESPVRESTGAVILTFPTTGTKSQPRAWELRQSLVDEYLLAYPSVDIVGECRRAYAWVMAHPSRKKTAAGMQRFLTGWLSKSQNQANARQPVRAGPANASRGQKHDPQKPLGDF